MLNIISWFYKLLCETFFDSKEEYDFRSDKFNSTRTAGVILFAFSIIVNFYLTRAYIIQAISRQHCEERIVKIADQCVQSPLVVEIEPPDVTEKKASE